MDRKIFAFAAVMSAFFPTTDGLAGPDVHNLRWTSQGDALTLDPHSQNEATTIAMSGSIYERLVNRDPALNLIPELAIEWSTVAPNIWEFKLRHGVNFHGGETFTAEDVVFSIARAKAESSNFKEQVASITQVIAIDDFTIQIVTNGPNPILPNELTSIFIMDKGWSELNKVTTPQDYAANEENYAVRHTNGTGPFVLESRAVDELTVLNAYPQWWGKAVSQGNVARIEYRPIKNPATRVAALLSGEVDFLLDPPLQDLSRIESTIGFKTETVAQIRTIFLGMDIASAQLRSSDIKGTNPFSDLRVRQALNMAIDREAIKEVVMNGMSFPAGMITSPGVHGYTRELDSVPILDVEKAKSLLTESGYSSGFSVRLDCPNDRYINDAAICEAVVGMLAKIGVHVNLEALPKAMHFPKVLDKTTDFYLLGWGVPTLDSQYVFQNLIEKSGSWNATGYDNPLVSQNLASIATEVDQAKRDTLIEKIWRIINVDLPYIPLHHQVIVWAMADTVDFPISADDVPRFSYMVMK